MIKEIFNSSTQKTTLDDGKVESKLAELQQDMIRLSRAGLNELDFQKGVIRLVTYTTKLCNRIFSDRGSSNERMKQAYGLALKAKLFLETVSKEFGENTGKLLDLKASIHFNLASWHHKTQNMSKLFEILLEGGKFCYRLLDMNFPSGAVMKVLTWLAWVGVHESNHSLAIQYSRTLENVLYDAMQVRCDDPVEHEKSLAESIRRAGGESLKTVVLLSLSYYFSSVGHASLANEKKALFYCQKLQLLVPKRIQNRGKADDWEIFKEMIKIICYELE